MIIGLSGYMKSGKDTVGQMIIKLTTPGEYNDKYGIHNHKDSPFEIRKFADTLKGVAALMLGVPREKFEDQDFKESTLGPEWNNMTVRKFLQTLGTDAVRNNLHKDAWVISAMNGIQSEDNVIFTDCRFPNEAQAIKNKGGIIIRISREIPGVSQKFIDRSESESSLDDWKFDYTIQNLGTLNDLENQVKEILRKVKQVNFVNT